MNKQYLVTRSSLPPFEEYTELIKKLWESRWLTNMGVYHQTLTQKLEQYLQVNHVSLFTNGHMALELLIQAMKLSGEVITTPFTFVSTTHAITRNGLVPVFCDINEGDYTIDVSKIEELITDKTCAILPVHVYGKICNVEEIEKIAQKYNLKVIYDAAHAFGVTYKGKGIGGFGDASMFSFHATKVFNTIEGGAVACSDEKLIQDLYYLKNFGITSEENVEAVGANAKMNEFQAAMGICNLRHVDEEIQKREAVYNRYIERLHKITGITIPAKQNNVKSNYAYFPIRIDPEDFGTTRDDIYNRLKEKGIFTRKYFYPLTNMMRCYNKFSNFDQTPVALHISKRILTLPMYADLKVEDVDFICDSLLKLKNRE